MILQLLHLRSKPCDGPLGIFALTFALLNAACMNVFTQRQVLFHHLELVVLHRERLLLCLQSLLQVDDFGSELLSLVLGLEERIVN